MNFRKYLIKHKDLIDNPKECFFLFWFFSPHIKGTYKNYRVVLGIEITSSKGSGNHYTPYFKVKLNNPPKIPLYFKDSFNLGGNDVLRYGWLYTFYYGSYSTKKEKVSYFKNNLRKFYETHLPRLENKAMRLDSGELKIDKQLKKQSISFKKDLYLVLFLIIGAIIICYCLIN